MKKLIYRLTYVNLIISVILIGVCSIPSKMTYERPKCPLEAQNASINDLIDYHACIYETEAEPLKKVAYCESRLNPKAINYHDGGKGKHSVGIFQFQERTFNYWETKLGEDLDYYSAYDQAKLASYMFSQNQQKQWTCSRLMKVV